MGHAGVATGRGGFSLYTFKQALAHFEAQLQRLPPRGLKSTLCVARNATPRLFLGLSEAHTMWVMQALPQDVAALACSPLNRRLRISL
ncbi:hypothetical protein SAMN05216244_0850 [Sediminibacillus halophilus]|uniref:Uncharacterized protein n=1 Tax=Sediminibacillus halophilus TaxID=482461 RepID=A0A1G9N5F3_9BACI|nr:hypothetical protein SAMN05216244_0850 [Sediminibacillus halophilus]